MSRADLGVAFMSALCALLVWCVWMFVRWLEESAAEKKELEELRAEMLQQTRADRRVIERWFSRQHHAH